MDGPRAQWGAEPALDQLGVFGFGSLLGSSSGSVIGSSGFTSGAVTGSAGVVVIPGWVPGVWEA